MTEFSSIMDKTDCINFRWKNYCIIGDGGGVSSFYKIVMNIFNLTHNSFVPAISSTFLYHM